MGAADDHWARYDAWNRTIAEVVYAPDRAGQPVCPDLEEDVLGFFAQRAEPGCNDPKWCLVDVVMGTIRFGLGTRILHRPLDRLDRQRSGPMVDPPPCLALLALLGLSAENMRQSDGIPSHNFYGRLSELAKPSQAEHRASLRAYLSPSSQRQAGVGRAVGRAQRLAPTTGSNTWKAPGGCQLRMRSVTSTPACRRRRRSFDSPTERNSTRCSPRKVCRRERSSRRAR